MESKREMKLARKRELKLRKMLLRAAEGGDARKVRELLQCKEVDTSYVYTLEKDVDGWGYLTSFRLACVRGHLETVRVFLEHGGETQEELDFALCDAASKGHVAMLNLLLEGGADPTARNNWAFRTAVEHGHNEVVEVLLRDPRVDPAAEDNAAFREASMCGHCEVVEILLTDPRVDPAADHSVAFELAAERGHLAVVKILLRDARVDPSALNNHVVCVAAKFAQRELLQLLLADHRVGGTRAIPDAHPLALPLLLEDERCGIHWNRALFEEYHGREVSSYDRLVGERTARILAGSWAMKQIGQGWGDLREPTEERMGAQSVFGDGKQNSE